MTTCDALAYCSHCFQLTSHDLLNSNLLTRHDYRCAGCGETTQECRFCRHMSKSGEHLCAEHDGTIASFERLDMRLSGITDFSEIFRRDAVNIKRAAKIAAFTMGGAAVLGPAAIASSGLAAGSSLLLGSSGVGVIAATGTALGSTLGGVISNSYFRDVEGFDITLVKSGLHPRIIFIDGFLSQKNGEPDDWKTALQQLYPDNAWYRLSWESKCLTELGQYIGVTAGKEITEKMLLAWIKKQGGTGPFGAALTAAGLISNPWHIAMVKAAQTGVLLADIIARTDASYILCGHSLGARVIYYALKDLATRSQPALIDSVHLLGGAVDNDRQEWESILPAVRQRINNYHSNNDWVLATLYQASTALMSKPIGYKPIASNHRALINHDVSALVAGHCNYKEQFHRFAKT